MGYDYMFKLMLCGDSGVGKTCLFLQLTEKRFQPVHGVTMGAEFGTKMLEVSEKSIKLQIWDMAGKEAFRSITRSYFRGCAGAILVHDITRRDTFENLASWIEDIKQNSGHAKCITIVGNKTDLEQHRQVSFEEGKSFAQQNICYFLETSAKMSSDSADEVFIQSAEKIYESIEEGLLDIGAERGQAWTDSRGLITTVLQSA